MANGGEDHRGFVQRIREARRISRGPFNGSHVCRVVEEEGYETVDHETVDLDDGKAFRIYRKDGCKPVPVNSDWRLIWDKDPTFRCIQRDLGFSRSELRTRLNEARNHDMSG